MGCVEGGEQCGPRLCAQHLELWGLYGVRLGLAGKGRSFDML